MLTTVRNLPKYIKSLIPGNYFYTVEPNKFLLTDNSDANIEYLNTLSRDDLQIFDLSDEPYRESMAERMSEILTRLKFKKYLVLSHSLKYLNNPSYTNIIYFPHNALDPIYYWNQETALAAVDNSQRQYFASCLNAQARLSRIYNYIKIIKKPYVGKLLLSAHNSPVDDNMSVSHPNDSIPDEFMYEWNYISTLLPKLTSNDLDIEHPAYHDAYINLVTETYTHPFELFFSEKIWKPIACGQLFLVISSTGAVAHLRDMGFDTFDDIIDHSRYDHIVDWRQRIDVIHEILDELSEFDWAYIYRETRDRRLTNARHFFSGLAVKPYMTNLANRMSYIDKKIYNYDHHIFLSSNNIRSPLYKNIPNINYLFR